MTFNQTLTSQFSWPASPPGGARPDAEQCVSNISRAEQLKRLGSGIFSLALAVLILAVLLGVGADRLWRLALLPVFWGAASGYFQWRDKT